MSITRIQWPKVWCYHTLEPPEEFWRPHFEILTAQMIFLRGVRADESFMPALIDLDIKALMLSGYFYKGSVLRLVTQFTGDEGKPIFHDGWDEELLTVVENNCQRFRLCQSVETLITDYVQIIPHLYTLCSALPPDNQGYVRSVRSL